MMLKMNIKMLVLMITVLVLVPSNVSAEEEKSEFAKDAKAAILIESNSGEVLAEKNSEEQLPPASMTKIMTMLLIMEALEEEKINLNDKVIASERAASMGGSQIFLEEGEEMSVKDLLKGIAVASGNDASVAMAEYLSGSEEKFVEKMNERAEQLGANRTQFQNATGLPAEDHYTTANDLALISKELLRHKDILSYTSIYEDYLRKGSKKEFWLVNTNRLVKHTKEVDGLKTGYTSEAKYNLTATADREGMRVITVVMGADTPSDRNKYTMELIKHAFDQYKYVVLQKAGTPLGDIRIEKGAAPVAKATLTEDAAVVVPKNEKADSYKVKVDIEKKLTAPVKKGTKAGEITYYDGKDKILTKQLVLEKEIKTANWATLFKRTVSTMTGHSKK
ncbi:D-alanyl-D-alanine carboxypeptidase family protein [Alteribacillus sp. HJP-4]|uniref:D-alanyl-D-alanine carboxypeptidase family protein n=1 Tax=Alteribacillus sp. HJP-4 TaxID=2775394 RepID=UPI0035CCD324